MKTNKGEAKAAQERVSFQRRDVRRGEARLADSEQAAVRLKEKLVLIRNRDPDLWGALGGGRCWWAVMATAVVAPPLERAGGGGG